MPPSKAGGRGTGLSHALGRLLCQGSPREMAGVAALHRRGKLPPKRGIVWLLLVCKVVDLIMYITRAQQDREASGHARTGSYLLSASVPSCKREM